MTCSPYHCFMPFPKVSNIRRAWVRNAIIDHSNVFGASLVGAAPTTSSFSTVNLASIYCAKATASRVDKHLSCEIRCVLYSRFYGNPKQWLMIHISEFMRMIRWSTITPTVIKREVGKLKMHSPIYCIKGNWEKDWYAMQTYSCIV